MNPSRVSFRAVAIGATIPRRQSEGAAGYDIYTIESGEIAPQTVGNIRTGFTLSIPFDILGLVMGRSGLALKKGMEVKCSYVKNGEEVIVTMYNNGIEPFRYGPNERIAQLVFLKTDCSDICTVE